MIPAADVEPPGAGHGLPVSRPCTPPGPAGGERSFSLLAAAPHSSAAAAARWRATPAQTAAPGRGCGAHGRAHWPGPVCDRGLQLAPDGPARGPGRGGMGPGPLTGGQADPGPPDSEPPVLSGSDAEDAQWTDSD